jgi:predicted dehydrogenase
MGRVNLGVIGCGFIGPQHMQSAVELDNIDLVAVADVDEARARSAAEKFGAAKWYTDPIALINDPAVDGVILALPAGLRVDLALEALKRKKPIMVEKPAARSLVEYDNMATAAGNTIVACASARYAFMPHTAPLREFIKSGALGPVRSIHFRSVLPPGPPPAEPPPAWRVSRELNGGGILVNWSSYELDYIWGLMNWSLKPRHVLAKWWQIPPQYQQYVAPDSDADEHFAAFIGCDDNIAVYLERGERVASLPESSMRIVGTNGTVELSWIPAEGKKILFHSHADGPESKVIWEGDEGWEYTRLGIVEDFARAIAEKGQPHTNLERGRILQQITEAIYLSGDEGRPVAV